MLGPMIVSAANLGLAYAERLLVGIDAKQFARFARPGGVVVASNHPAFVLGHLALYPARVLEFLGRPAAAAAAPAGWDAIFKAGVACQDDADGTLYPPMSALTETFLQSSRAAHAAVAAASDAQLAAPNPAEGRSRELFPVVGGMITFYLVGHVQMHLGQLSAWRRAMGLPAA
ncbi:MAG: DinB family protein [Phycisphaerae bacterium]